MLMHECMCSQKSKHLQKSFPCLVCSIYLRGICSRCRWPSVGLLMSTDFCHQLQALDQALGVLSHTGRQWPCVHLCIEIMNHFPAAVKTYPLPCLLFLPLLHSPFCSTASGISAAAWFKELISLKNNKLVFFRLGWFSSVSLLSGILSICEVQTHSF